MTDGRLLLALALLFLLVGGGLMLRAHFTDHPSASIVSKLSFAAALLAIVAATHADGWQIVSIDHDAGKVRPVGGPWTPRATANSQDRAAQRNLREASEVAASLDKHPIG